MSASSELCKAKLLVMEDVTYVKKESAKGLNYTFASEAEFIAKLRPAMIKHGLSIAPVGNELLESSEYQNKSGTTMFRVRVRTTYRLTHAPSGEFEEIATFGEATDTGDKTLPKAMTQSLKYALRQPFLIETGDDPDRDASVEAEPQSNKVTTAQKAVPATGNASEAAFNAIATCKDLDYLAKLEAGVLKGIGTKFSTADGSTLMAKIAAKRKELGGPGSLSEQYREAVKNG